jgi:hypothetical protein
MSDFFAHRIASDLFTRYSKDGSFDVDFIDSESANDVSRELEKLGCKVCRWPFKSAIHVICPENGQAVQLENAATDLAVRPA